jgi:hypothetical protein
MKDAKDVTAAMNSPARKPSETDPPMRTYAKTQPIMEKVNTKEK